MSGPKRAMKSSSDSGIYMSLTSIGVSGHGMGETERGVGVAHFITTASAHWDWVLYSMLDPNSRTGDE